MECSPISRNGTSPLYTWYTYSIPDTGCKLCLKDEPQAAGRGDPTDAEGWYNNLPGPGNSTSALAGPLLRKMQARAVFEGLFRE